MESAIAPPTDLGELFASLDFETIVAGQENMSLIRQRGDGIQARHIPEMLSFVAEKDDHQFHILALEEPENSLSVNSALRLGERIRTIATEDSIQTFVTTHSPTFYTLDGAQVKKVFLRNAADGQVNVLDGTQSSKQELLTFMGDSFYLPLVADSVAEADRRAQASRAEIEALQQRIQNRDRSLLFVEGPSDAIIVQAVLNALGAGAARLFEVVSLEGVTHAERFSTMSKPVIQGLLGQRRGFILLDGDKAGRSVLPKSINHTAARGWMRSANGIYWHLIPPTEEATEAFRAAGINDLDVPGVTMEDVFSADLRNQAMQVGSYGLSGPRDFLHQKADLFVVSPALTDPVSRFYLLSPDERSKTAFSNWIVENNHQRCPTLERILVQAIEAERAEQAREQEPN